MPIIVPLALSSIRYEPADPAAPSDWREGVLDAIQRLPGRLSQVVILYYYGEDGHPWTQKQIGQRLGISDERVRQLLQAAYAQLRRPCKEFIQP